MLPIPPPIAGAAIKARGPLTTIPAPPARTILPAFARFAAL